MKEPACYSGFLPKSSLHKFRYDAQRTASWRIDTLQFALFLVLHSCWEVIEEKTFHIGLHILEHLQLPFGGEVKKLPLMTTDGLHLVS